MKSTNLNSSNYITAFAELDQLLTQFTAIWRPTPFTEETLDWQSDYPELYQALLGLSDSVLASFDDEAVLLAWMTKYLPALEVCLQWQIAPFEGELTPMPRFADVGIPGRKKQQIVGFASAVGSFIADGQILDWCSGKGFLARQLHFVSGQKITCLEYDQVLCEAGEQLAGSHGDDIEFITQNVLQPIAPDIVNCASLHTALHACGDLHVAMLRTVTKAQSPHIALSPCCYHLTKNPLYDKLSQRAKQSSLQLSKTDLRLAVLQTVTAGSRVKRLRELELVWRIGYDLLRREVTGVAYYEPTPSINKQWLSGDFVDYCHFIAAKQQLVLPQVFDSERLLAEAKVKYQRIARLDKARLAFRRVIEYWLLLDRVLLLQEQNYQVDLCLFCDTAVSPRNALISGQLCLSRRRT